MRWLVRIAVAAVLFGLGIAVGQALQDRPRARPPVTNVSTIRPWTPPWRARLAGGAEGRLIAGTSAEYEDCRHPERVEGNDRRDERVDDPSLDADADALTNGGDATEECEGLLRFTFNG